jgi:hypothetical protein
MIWGICAPPLRHGKRRWYNEANFCALFAHLWPIGVVRACIKLESPIMWSMLGTMTPYGVPKITRYKLNAQSLPSNLKFPGNTFGHRLNPTVFFLKNLGSPPLKESELLLRRIVFQRSVTGFRHKYSIPHNYLYRLHLSLYMTTVSQNDGQNDFLFGPTGLSTSPGWNY